MKELTEEDIRKIIREALSDINLQEFDALYPKKQDWKDASKELRSCLVDLLKNIENDEYQEGVDKIEDVIEKLKDWKIKIQKFLS